MASKPTESKLKIKQASSQVKIRLKSNTLDATTQERIKLFFSQFQEDLVPISELREQLAKELKGLSLSEVVRQMRSESSH